MIGTTTAVSCFEPDNVDFNFKMGDGNKKRVYVNKSASVRQGIKLQLCDLEPSAMLRTLFGISDPMPGSVADPNRHTVDVAMDNVELGKKIRVLDEKCIQYAHKDSVKCFGKQLDIGKIRDRFTSPYREVEGEGRSNLLRVKIPVETCELLLMSDYDEKEKQISCTKCNTDAIRAGSRVVPVVDVSALWFVSGGNQFGYSMVATNILVDQNSSNSGNSGNQPFVMTNGASLSIEDE